MSAQKVASFGSALAVAIMCFGVFNGTVVFSCVCLLLLYHWKKLVIISKTFKRDLRCFKLFRKAYKFLSDCSQKDRTIIDLFREQLKKQPKKTIFYFEDQSWNFSEAEIFSNKIGNVFQDMGFAKGDTVALLMGNCLEYIGIWFGLAKIGVVTALINTNLQFQPLVHCFNAAKIKAIIYSEEFESVVEEISVSGQLDSIRRFRWGKTGGRTHDTVTDLYSVATVASASPPASKATIGYKDKVLYVYTSGTTGLPKAAIIPHHRLLMMLAGISCAMDIKVEDTIYNPLPLFHTLGGLLGIVGPLGHGCASVIRKKFSATAFWPDCIKYNCTVAQYIGEMCRYVMMVPPRAEDTKHKVKFIFGIGMKTSLWLDFKERFRLERISEMYGSTEGNANLVNLDKTVGAVGFLPRILPVSLVPMALIKVDEFGVPIRDSKGLCIRCEPNEPGMFIGMITKSDATRAFSGYLGDKKETEKKIVENVFKKGDKAFLSGDILVMDELGYLYFKDRTGDTFKWKGENVSTAEVEGIISAGAELRDVLVYGVEVGNLEGRAGMATIVDPQSKLDLEDLSAYIEKNLPSYARPLFLRITDHVDLTGTFKLRKLNFQKEGFNPEEIKDKLYFRTGNSKYVPLTKKLYDEIMSGVVRI